MNVRARSLPAVVWAPIVAALTTAVPGLVGLASGTVLLFPSLGPSAVMMAQSPERASSRPYAVVTAHIVGLASAFAAVAVFRIAHAPSVFAVRELSPARVAAAILAIALGTLVESLLDAQHPPAASTTLLAALGSFKPTVHDTLLVIGGVVIVAAIGEMLRRLRLRGENPAALPRRIGY